GSVGALAWRSGDHGACSAGNSGSDVAEVGAPERLGIAEPGEATATSPQVGQKSRVSLAVLPGDVAVASPGSTDTMKLNSTAVPPPHRVFPLRAWSAAVFARKLAHAAAGNPP